MVLGIDLCREYAQVSVFNKKDNVVDTPVLLNCDNSTNIPVAICKKKGKDEWCIADELKRLALLSEGIVVEDLIGKLYEDEMVFVDNTNVSPFELLFKFIKNLINLATKDARIDGVCISLEDYNIRILDALKHIFEKLEFDMSKVEFLNRNETAMYYVFNQKREIWYADVALFDYRDTGLVVSMIGMKKSSSGEVIYIEDYDCSEDLPYFYVSTELQKENVSKVLTEIAMKLFSKRVVSGVFLTGVGFDYDFNFDGFVRYICNKRRVFGGQNIFSRGACYGAMELAMQEKSNDRILICQDKLMYELSLDITERGNASRLRIVKPGTNWYKARKKYDFFVEDEKEIVLHKKNFGESFEETIRISLEELPVRPDKATKIGVGFDFTPEGRCLITIKDRGFGNFYKSSGKFICKEI